MKVTNDAMQSVIKFCEQVDTLLFQSLESTSQLASQNLIEMAIEKNNDIKRFLTKPPTEKGSRTSSLKPAHSGFPQRLKHAMKAAGLTQKELAERTGVSQSVISRLITGKDKTGTRSGVLSHALGVNFDWLHYGTGEMYPANFSADNREV